MEIIWLSAFIDLPEAQFAPGAQFWARVTNSSVSPPHGDDGEFRTMIPETGDPYLHIQKTRSDQSEIHLDVYVSDVAAARSTAVALGASVVSVDQWSVMKSPAGFVFCFVSDVGDRRVPEPVSEPRPHRLDQVSIDVPAPLFDTECTFWQELFGWELRRGALEEYAVFVRPEGIPLRLILQRLGETDPGSSARAHLDVACGDGAETIADRHQDFGAVRLRTGTYWITMSDPTGYPYCLTIRNPNSGTLTA